MAVAPGKVVTGWPPKVTVLTPGRKPVPLMVSVKDAPPAVAEAGLRPAIVGAGWAVANVPMGDVAASPQESVPRTWYW